MDIAQPFFETFAKRFNIITYECRLILAPPSRKVVQDELTVDNHAKDLLSLLKYKNINNAILVGYCSGAGIALATENQSPQSFSHLILINGEYTLLDDPDCITQYGMDISNLLPIAAMSEDKAQFILSRLKLENPDVPCGVNLPFSQAHYFHRYAINYLSYRSVEYKKLARAVSTPTLLVTGTKDLQTNVSSTEKIQSLILDSLIHIESDGDHYGLLRERSKTLAYLYDYLSMELTGVV
ncbi:alpha/beta fold hydrolase [Microbulbifer sp. THAF38]|uniref:alpha/beta fold hydrolase n=1 Tax=Microbulbifer sp. THAF38 TaxID=2587856 RepID=UPI00126862FC|nr:alpha/beta hydrolase [Microbulbifer sp. THAF38]